MRKLLAVGALVAVAGACLSRRPAEVGTAFRVPAAPEKAKAVAIRLEADPVRRTADELHITHRDEFAVAAQEVVLRLHRAQARRQHELSVASPDVQVSIDSDVTYEQERQAALERLEPFLDQSGAHQEFRENLETWAATTWTRSQGIYRRRTP